jgi:dTDP-4-amino-4,6-dideoxygalactose transaminase
MAKVLALYGGPKAVTLPMPRHPVTGHEEINGVVRALMTGQFSQVTRGGVVAEMEDAIVAYFGVRHCHSFNSGTAAIASGLFALGVGPGDEVLTASNTWISGVCAICHAGAVPVFCDVKKGAQHIDPGEIRRKAGPHTKAVIVTHLWGIPADMDPIMAAARERGLAVLEDGSHAHGGRYKGKLLGTIGDIGAFSLQGSKAIVAGEGGFLITNKTLWYERSMIPGDHGTRLKQELKHKQLAAFTHGGGAWTYRIAPMCAAVALAQLQRLDALNAARQANFDRIRRRLRRSVPFIKWPRLARGSVRGWYGTPASYDYQGDVSRDAFVEAVAAEGARIRGNGYDSWYTVPLFQDPEVYGQLWPVEHVNGASFRPIPRGSLKNTERLRQKNLLFPIPPVEMPRLMDQIAAGVEKVASNMAALGRTTERRTNR